MVDVVGLINTTLGAGIASAMVYYLALTVGPLIAAILWTLPFTMIFPIYNMHTRDKKSNTFIAAYLRTQTHSMVLLLVFLYATAHFVDTAPKDEGILEPLAKGTGVWAVAGIIYYIIVRMLSKKA